MADAPAQDARAPTARDLTTAFARRGVRRLTAPVRPMPDVIIIGAMKCGTTSAAWYLNQHPRVRGASRKEVHYFDHHYTRGDLWYRAFLPLGLPGRTWLSLEATPYYLSYPLAPRRVARACPEAKLIALLRDPAARAVSQWKQRSRENRESRTLEQVLAEERELPTPDPVTFGRDRAAAQEHLARVLDHGMYAAQLRRWFEHFPREQVLVMESTELFTDPQSAMTRMHGFLGIEPFETPDVRARNVGDRREAEPAAMQGLRDFYRPHNEELFELLGERWEWG